MGNGKEAVLSRRQMVGMLSVPVVGAIGSSVMMGKAAWADVAAWPMMRPFLKGTRTFNIRDFGATGDGKTLDTKAVQAAMDGMHGRRGWHGCSSPPGMIF